MISLPLGTFMLPTALELAPIRASVLEDPSGKLASFFDAASTMATAAAAAPPPEGVF